MGNNLNLINKQMKTSIAILLLLGAISSYELPKDGQLMRLNTSAYDDDNADAESGEDDDKDESEDEDGDEEDDEDVQLSAQGPCVYLDEAQDELDYQVDMFSRTFDPRHWKNALAIAGKIGNKAKGLKVHAWELYDKAFTFPRVRRYNMVNDNMDMLEHFQDNLNTNISNEVNMERFLRAAKTV